MESIRPVIVPGPFPLGSYTPPNGGFLNPGVWFMLWIQVTSRLVQCWSSYKIIFHLEWPLSPWESTLRLSLFTETRMMSRCVDIVLHGVKRLRPVRPPSFPSWDLSVVLKGLLEPPFESLESAAVRILTLKVTLLLVLASFKRVGNLALSVSKSCTEFAPGLVKEFLRPRPGYVPKVLSTSFRSQVVVLQAFSPSLPC